MPRPTRRGWRMHQKQSVNATKSGISRKSRHGRKLRNSASANEPTIVDSRTGIRIEELLGPIALLLGLCGIGLRRRLLRPARLLAAILARLGALRARRTARGLVRH